MSEPGLGFDPTKRDSNNNGESDFADYTEPRAYGAEHSWTQGSADSQDWAAPGHQH